MFNKTFGFHSCSLKKNSKPTSTKTLNTEESIKMTTYTKHLSEPWFSLIKIEAKTCEGRLNTGDFYEMKKGDTIIFTNDDFKFSRSFRCEITSVHNYSSFEEYLHVETLEKCLPGMDTIDEGVDLYYNYYKKEDENKYKIKALHLSVIK